MTGITGEAHIGPKRNRHQAEPLDLSSLSFALRQRWWVVVATALVGIIVGLLVAGVIGPRHSASLAVRATANENVTSLSGTPGVSTVEDERKQLIFQLSARATLEALREDVGSGVIDLFVTAPESSPLLTVTVVADDPERASDAVAMAIASIIDERRAKAIDQASIVAGRLREQADSLTAEVDALTAEIAAIGPPQQSDGVPTPLTPSESARLEVSRGQLESLLADQSFYEQRATEIEFDSLTTPIGIMLVGSDVPTVESAYPTRIHLLALLGAAGFIFGVTLLWIKELRQGPRLTDARLAGLYPAVPISGLGFGRGRSLDSFAVRLIDSVERGQMIAYIQMGQPNVDTSIGSLPLAHSLTVIRTVTSIINCDLRSGTSDDPPGITSYLTGQIGASELAARSSTRDEPRQVPSGPSVPNPLAVARNAPMAPMLGALRALSDCVLLTVADPILVPEVPLLISGVSAAILEVVPGRLHVSDLEHVDVLLEQLQIAVIGVVVRPPPRMRNRLRRTLRGAEVQVIENERGPRRVSSSDHEAAI